ncbi:MAG: Gas vesicle synthesis protein GvpO [Candidatus Bathyarchaeota archaeon BA2]|nr:MAG: Gas vesicle synthesis protein GvpO [Candidatus Bathyarchaeota archaeon BA2]
MATEKPRASVEKITDLALAITKKYISKEPETVIGIEQREGEWKVMVEALERKAVPDTQDLLGRYEIRLNKNGELIGWKQTMIRKRSDRMVPPEEEWVVTG